MHIFLGYRKDFDKNGFVKVNYATCFHIELEKLGHIVTPIGEGHPLKDIKSVPKIILNKGDFFLDIDCGRNKEGNVIFQCQERRIKIPSVLRSIDAHGQSSLHRRAAKNYDHVFFAVWNKRDLFVNHPSAHWCPCASDETYFNPNFKNHPAKYDFGFFGSKDGLNRADLLKIICDRHYWTWDVREVGRNRNPWPDTAKAMGNCRVLFNKGQKHDSPNQRVIESMLMSLPLITERDNLSGMDKLFEEGEHYLGWTSESELANQMEWSLREYDLAKSMAERAYQVVVNKHQIKHRIQQILEVVNAKN